MTHFFYFFTIFLYVAVAASDSFKVKQSNEVYTTTNGVDSPETDFKSAKNTFKSKTSMMAEIFRKKVERIKFYNETELIILVDGSSSIGEENFKSEMKYIQKVISDMNLGPMAVRLAVIIYSTKYVTHVNHLESEAEEHEKCSLLHYHLPSINYTGGSTNTRDALIETDRILSRSRPSAQKIVFLVTDGFSNRGDPVPVAEHLKRNSTVIYTFGIENGNVEELRRIASSPVQEHSFLFESFGEFEGFERRALHQDLKPGIYTSVKNSSLCDLLCEDKEGGCCHVDAKCSCGELSGHFSCLCPPGYYGTGLKNEGCKLCPNGTYSDGSVPGDGLVCFPCPDIHQFTTKSPAVSKSDCSCMDGYVPDGDKCKVITCPDLSPPDNGYFVKKKCSNVLNAACGIRCHMGFTLFGSSVRICQKNGTWSGEAPTCEARNCDNPKPVANSEITCVNEEKKFEVFFRFNSTGGKVKHYVKWTDANKEDNGTLSKPLKLQESDMTTNVTVEPNFSVDTECSYSCLSGYFLVGSRSRSCLPLLKWGGLKTTCKDIKCQSLQKIENGTITPQNCTTKGLKHSFAETCTYSCNSGYELKGPNVTSCVGRHGTWSEKNNPSKCVDVESPTFLCPSNLTVSTDEGVHFATVNFSLPNATDNSGKEPIVWSKPPFEENYPLRFIIGSSEVEIYSVDDSGNYAFCSFHVTVQDEENPKILECESPPVFFVSEFPPNSTEIKWKEPVVDDNSGIPIPLKRVPATSEFPLGITPILYTATDSSGNNASCSLNITILENPCSERPEVTNTRWNCSTDSDHIMCNVSCSEGHAFANFTSSGLSLNCTYAGRKAHWTPDIFHGDLDLFPDCSEIEVPTEILGEIEIDASEELCEDLELLSNEIANEVHPEMENKNFPIITVCEDEPHDEKNETKNEKEVLEEDTNVIRRKRNIRKRKKKLKISFAVNGSLENEELNKDLKITEEKLRNIYMKRGRPHLNETGGSTVPVIRTNIRLKCRKGSLLKGNICVKCPKGTFHNLESSSCDPCPLGQYQEIEGQVTCTSCPEGFFTKKIRTKHRKQCRKICPPGTYGKKIPKMDLSLAPCTRCPIGYYQPLVGQTFCEKCSDNFTTVKRGSTNISQCLRKSELEDLCFQFHCRNGGTCFVNDGFAICKCPPGFLGAFCERKFNPCASSPCFNSGECIVTNIAEYTCRCPDGFEGNLCEREINECLSNPCGNHGECIDLFGAFRCNCFPGFKGETCKEKISHCQELQPCFNNATCLDIGTSYECVCTAGFTGFHCEEPPLCNADDPNCDERENQMSDILDLGGCWNVSCPENMKCKVPWDRVPLCVCVDGMRGENCTEVINPHVILNFPRYGVTEYLSSDFPQGDLTEISVCVWIQTKDDFNYGTLFSYSTLNDDNAFTLTDYSGLVLYVSGNHTVTDLTANDGLWHFICVTWQSLDGNWQIFLDGSIHSSGKGLSNNSVLPGGGKLIIGQEQDFLGGGFNELESFSGKLTYFDVWGRALQSWEVQNFYETCNEVKGNLITWLQLLQSVNGGVLEEESNFCKACKTNLTLFRGQIHYEKLQQSIQAKYVCDEGFFLKFESKENKGSASTFSYRKCMKYGNWEAKEPTCSRVSCGFPGYFLNGKIIGGSYLFGDVITYRCDEEYSLVGNDTRFCQTNGAWSGEAPSCRGNSLNCRKLVAPRHGSMFVYFSLDKPYRKILPSVGDRIEFTCDKGYNLKGYGMLTCLDGGIWDRKPPSCEEIRCQYPKDASHLINPEISNSTSFYFGDSLTVTCASGAKKIISCGEFGSWNFSSNTCEAKCFEKPKTAPVNGYLIDDGRKNHFYEEGEAVFVKCVLGFTLLGDNRLLCSENGTWIRSQPTICSSIRCGPPPPPPYPYFIIFEEGHLFNKKVFLDCADGFYKNGPIFTKCGLNGQWTRIQNFCIKK